MINETISTKWYAAGLHFGCEVCGRCCAGPGEGYIWATRPEIELIAAALELHAGGAAVPIPAAGGTADHDRRAQPHQGLHLLAVGGGHEAVRDLCGPAGAVPHVAVLAGEPVQSRRVEPGRPAVPRHQSRPALHLRRHRANPRE